MHILKMIFHNVPLFKNDLEIDFTNSDTVRRSVDDTDYDLKAFKLKAGLYSHVLMAFTGLNATGKTTVLELLSMVSRIIIDGEKLNDPNIQITLAKIFPGSEQNQEELSWDVIFAHEDFIYQLHSAVKQNHEAGKVQFYYKDEQLLRKSLKSTKRDSLFDFSIDLAQSLTDRKKEGTNPYLKADMSIAASLGTFSEKLRPVGIETFMNPPLWMGTPSQEVLHLFDPNISNLKIEAKENGTPECQLRFRNQSNVVYGGSPFLLNRLLSSGTIRGLSIMPPIIQVLRNGGYVFIDEVENHFNKKIIEWFFQLFTDKRTNPHGACLVFTTHYPELLNEFSRKDNIFITRRDENYYCECVKYSDFITRNELSKSKIIFENAIQGTAPRFTDLLNAHQFVEEAVRQVNKS